MKKLMYAVFSLMILSSAISSFAEETKEKQGVRADTQVSPVES